ncbi:MAG: large conductance mechanosensitive channel protein MscL [Clostridia bacterium]|nr:large conductance mechanosensitive channel protein MscL [Clostridia bacterium]
MKKLIEEFKKFIKRGNVVDMAVGVAVASAFTAIVNAFTKGFISPLIAMLTGKSELDELKWIIRPEVLDEAGEVIEAEVAILWGSLVQAMVNFLIIAIALFAVMKIAAAIRERAEKINAEIKSRFITEEARKKEREEAAKIEAEAKAEQEARIEAEKEAEKQKARLEAEERERARLEREEALLVEIRDLLKNGNKQS